LDKTKVKDYLMENRTIKSTYSGSRNKTTVEKEKIRTNEE
jgi:hypothetical protein